MVKKILFFAALVTAFSTSVSANGFKAVVNPDDGSVYGIGKRCDQKQGDVFVTVIYPGADTDNLSYNLNDVSYVKAIDTDTYGNFELDYTLNSLKSGVYKLIINDGCEFSGHNEVFQAATASDVNTALSQFNALLNSAEKSISDFEAFVTANENVFGIDLNDTEYTACDKNTLWQMMKDEKPYLSNTDVFKRFYRVVGILGVGSANSTQIGDALGEYMLLADSESRLLFENLDSSGLNRLHSNVQSISFDALTFENMLREMLIVEIFNNNDRSVIKDYIEKYASEIGIDISANSEFGKLKDKSNVYVGIVNKSNFTSFSDIKNSFDNLVTYYLKKESEAASSSGSSSGGSNSSGAGISAVIKPNGNNTVGDTVKTSFSPFKDLDGALWAKSAIEYLYAKNIINGVSKTEFKPNDNVTREAFIKMLVAAFDIYDSSAITTEFSDVDNNKWYAPYIASGVKNGIVTGIGNGKFGVGNYISRQDMAVMLYRIIQRMNIDLKQSDTLSFSDSELFASYAKEAIEKLSAMGIVNGIEDGRFAPEAHVTRAMAAAVIARVIDR